MFLGVREVSESFRGRSPRYEEVRRVAGLLLETKTPEEVQEAVVWGQKTLLIAPRDHDGTPKGAGEPVSKQPFRKV